MPYKDPKVRKQKDLESSYFEIEKDSRDQVIIRPKETQLYNVDTHEFEISKFQSFIFSFNF